MLWHCNLIQIAILCLIILSLISLIIMIFVQKATFMSKKIGKWPHILYLLQIDSFLLAHSIAYLSFFVFLEEFAQNF